MTFELEIKEKIDIQTAANRPKFIIKGKVQKNKIVKFNFIANEKNLSMKNKNVGYFFRETVSLQTIF